MQLLKSYKEELKGGGIRHSFQPHTLKLYPATLRCASVISEPGKERASFRVAVLIFLTVLLISNIGDIPNISYSKTNKDMPFVRRGRVQRESGREGRALSGLFFSLSVSCPLPF